MICVWACDAYNTITSHDFSVKHQNNSHKFEKSFTINDWKSCYPNIPVDLPKRNDYVFGIYEMEVR